MNRKWSVFSFMGVVLLLLLVSLGAVACGGAATTTSTTAAATTTSAGATTTTAAATTTTAAAGPVKIGATLPFSGWAASYGESARMGVDFAVKEINDAGGIKGAKVEVVYEDTAADPKVAVTAIQKQIEVDKVLAVVGTMFSSEALAQGPIAQKAGVLMVTGMASHPDTPAAGNLIFMTQPIAYQDQGTVARYAAAEKGIKRMAFLASDSDYSRAGLDAVKIVLPKNGSELVFSEFYQGDTTDFKTVLSKMKAANPDGVMILGGPPDTAQIIKQMAELGIDVPICGSNMLMDAAVLEMLGADAMEGIWCAMPGALSGEAEKARDDFLVRWKAAHNGEMPPSSATYGTYDAAMMVLTAMKEVGTNPADVSAYLSGMKIYYSSLGELSFNEKRQPLYNMFINIFEGGKWVETDFHGAE